MSSDEEEEEEETMRFNFNIESLGLVLYNNDPKQVSLTIHYCKSSSYYY